MLNLEEVDHPLFSNPRCDRKLSLDAADAGGCADKRRRRGVARDWSDPVRGFVAVGGELGRGRARVGVRVRAPGAVVTVGEIADPREGPGGDFVGVDEEIVVRAARYLEATAGAVLVGEGGDDTGVKFL